jgi:SRSO17 transposase
MLARALDAGVPAAWVAGDEVYGADPGLRAWLEASGVGYVLAVACDHRVPFGGDTCRADALPERVPARAWQQLSCGKCAKGHRLYDWAFLRLDHYGEPDPGALAGQHWLMVRRHQRTGELAFYRCWMPRPVPLAALVRVAGQRWRIEERSRPARAWSAWTSTRCAAGAPGTAGPPWQCSPTPSWWSPPSPTRPAIRRRPG